MSTSDHPMMTILDRILCRFGFHDKLEATGRKIDVYFASYASMPMYSKMELQCTSCGRYCYKRDG